MRFGVRVRVSTSISRTKYGFAKEREQRTENREQRERERASKLKGRQKKLKNLVLFGDGHFLDGHFVLGGFVDRTVNQPERAFSDLLGGGDRESVRVRM